MSNTGETNIDDLLNAPPSVETARKLNEWADECRNRIARGDLMLGILTVEEVEKISSAYRTAAQFGDTDSWLKLAWWCASPDDGTPDLDAAESALKSAVDSEVPGAELELVKIRWFYKRDSASQEEQEQSYQIVFAIVEKNPKDSEATYYLALLTTHGFGTEADPETGFKLQQQAADIGNTDAMFELYIHLAHGLGVVVDEAAALDACRRAAQAGHPRAMYNMGAFNASGHGVEKNIPEAIEWYERAADEGNPHAMVGLAVIYATGDGVEADSQYAEQMVDQADYLGIDVSEIRESVGL